MILFKYTIKEILRYFAIIVAMVIAVYLAVDFFEKIDDFMEARLPFSKALSFFFYRIPFIVAQIMPVGVLLAVLVAFGLMSRHNEIIALKTSGVGTYCLLQPVLFLAVLFSLVLFLLSEAIVPISMDKANRIWLQEVRKGPAVASKEKNIWIKADHMITHIKFYNPAGLTVFGITVNYFDKGFKLIRKIDAKQAVYGQGNWHLQGVMEQNFTQAGENRVTLHDDRVEKLNFVPDDLKRVVKKSEEMNFKELYDYVRKVESEGYDATAYRIDLYAKFAFPLVCIIMSMIGSGISIAGRIKEGLPIGVAYGIGIAFSYWVFYSLCLSLGYGQMLPPVIAVWAANFVFFCAGILLLLYAE
ncbi:MAG: LPS export ABC transporter permease LptG [Desulfobacterales bacterium]|nr:LPS export ABC transporter permease LptG [Desulfobacterales bacterium]